MRSALLVVALLAPTAAHAESEVIDIIGHRPEPHHPEHPGMDRPGGGGMTHPEPTTEQRCAVLERQSFESAKAMSELEKYIEVWKDRSMTEYAIGENQELWRARLLGTIYGIHSHADDTLEVAKDHITVRIDQRLPISYRGIELPLTVTKVHVKFKGDAGEMTYFSTPKMYMYEEVFGEMFTSRENAVHAASMMLNDPEMSLQQIYDCVEKHTGNCPVFTPATGGFTGEGM